MAQVVKIGIEDMLALQAGGVDGVMFSNEFSVTCLFMVMYDILAAMAHEKVYKDKARNFTIGDLWS